MTGLTPEQDDARERFGIKPGMCSVLGCDEKALEGTRGLCSKHDAAFGPHVDCIQQARIPRKREGWE